MSVTKKQARSVNTERSKSSARKGLHFTKDELINLHWVKGLSLTEIGRKYGVSGAAIEYWTTKLGIEHRSQLQDVLFEPSPTLSYVFGVLHGDGFLYHHPTSNHHYILMSITDRIFGESFQRALRILGLRAHMIPLKPNKARPNEKPQWRVYASSRKFHELWNGLTSAERLEWGMNYPADFIRGVYESEGSLKYHRTTLELSIYNTNKEMQSAIYRCLSEMGLTVKWYERTLKSGKTFVNLALNRSLEIRRFLAWIAPVFKYQPRGPRDLEPSKDSDSLNDEAFTKAIRSRRLP